MSVESTHLFESQETTSESIIAMYARNDAAAIEDGILTRESLVPQLLSMMHEKFCIPSEYEFEKRIDNRFYLKGYHQSIWQMTQDALTSSNKEFEHRRIAEANSWIQIEERMSSIETPDGFMCIEVSPAEKEYDNKLFSNLRIGTKNGNFIKWRSYFIPEASENDSFNRLKKFASFFNPQLEQAKKPAELIANPLFLYPQEDSIFNNDLGSFNENNFILKVNDLLSDNQKEINLVVSPEKLRLYESLKEFIINTKINNFGDTTFVELYYKALKNEDIGYDKTQVLTMILNIRDLFLNETNSESEPELVKFLSDSTIPEVQKKGLLDKLSTEPISDFTNETGSIDIDNLGSEVRSDRRRRAKEENEEEFKDKAAPIFTNNHESIPSINDSLSIEYPFLKPSIINEQFKLFADSNNITFFIPNNANREKPNRTLKSNKSSESISWVLIANLKNNGISNLITKEEVLDSKPISKGTKEGAKKNLYLQSKDLNNDSEDKQPYFKEKSPLPPTPPDQLELKIQPISQPSTNISDLRLVEIDTSNETSTNQDHESTKEIDTNDISVTTISHTVENTNTVNQSESINSSQNRQQSTKITTDITEQEERKVETHDIDQKFTLSVTEDQSQKIEANNTKIREIKKSTEKNKDKSRRNFKKSRQIVQPTKSLHKIHTIAEIEEIFKNPTFVKVSQKIESSYNSKTSETSTQTKNHSSSGNLILSQIQSGKQDIKSNFFDALKIKNFKNKSNHLYASMDNLHIPEELKPFNLNEKQTRDYINGLKVVIDRHGVMIIIEKDDLNIGKVKESTLDLKY